MTLASQWDPRLGTGRTGLSALFLAEMVGSQALGLGDDPVNAEGPWALGTPRPLVGCYRCPGGLVTLRITRSWQYWPREESLGTLLYRGMFLLA